MLIALDTATRWAGIALYSPTHGLLSECNWHSSNRHTVELMPAVAHMLARAGANPSDLRAVAVALGPGSFTGLRVALAAAKGLALALEIAIIGVPTLDVVAYPHREASWPVAAVVQAGRGRVCWAQYANGPQGWGTQAPFALNSVQEMGAQLTGTIVIAGEWLAADREALIEILGDRAHLLPPSVGMRRAGHLAEIAWSRLLAGDCDDRDSLSPIYLHEPPKPSSPVEAP